MNNRDNEKSEKRESIRRIDKYGYDEEKQILFE